MNDDKKIPGRRRRRCKICEKLKYGVISVIHPYDEDVIAFKHTEPICPECFKNLQDDI